jgi:hypothetical protein
VFIACGQEALPDCLPATVEARIGVQHDPNRFNVALSQAFGYGLQQPGIPFVLMDGRLRKVALSKERAEHVLVVLALHQER